MNYAPVAMFVYNRADHFEQTFDALSKCREAENTVLYIFSDGAKNESSALQVENVRRAAREKANSHSFKEIKLIESPENKGLARSIISGVTEVIGKYGKIIVLEDDCVTSPYFLKFMNEALDFYEKDKTVGSIAGFTPQMNYPENFNDDVFVIYRSCSWGWATWNNIWKNVDWGMKDFSDFIKSKENIKRINSGGSDRFLRLYRQRGSNSTSWSVRFGAHLIKNNLTTVYPRYSYISNIGCDNTGVHSRSGDGEKLRVDLTKAIPNPKIKHVEIKKEIQKEFKSFYSAGKLSDLKRYIASKAILIKER